MSEKQRGLTPFPPLREVALRAIHGAASQRVFLADALRREFDRADFPASLRSAAGDLASGVVRRRITLDHLLAGCSDRPLKRVNPLLLDLLRLAAYEIVFVEKIPPHASVSEAVNLTKRLIQPAFAGFTNAVLRKFTRRIASRGDADVAQAPPPVIDVAAGADVAHPPPGEAASLQQHQSQPRAAVLHQKESQPGAAVLRQLITPDGRVVRFTVDVFPDPQSDPAGYLASAGGMPRWLVERWIANFGCDEAFRIVDASNSEPPVTIRANALVTDPDASGLRAKLSERGVETAPGGIENSLRVLTPVELTALAEFAAGEFYIQDESAMRAAVWLGPKAADKILDLCAAPGGKATHLAELSRDRAEIYALDQSAERMLMVEANARRLGIQRLRTAVGDARKISDKGKGWFHAALADVPCSNTGVLRRRVEARHRLKCEALAGLVAVQADILRTALASVRLGGRVVYSTCSIEPEENGDLVRRVLAEQSVWRLDAEELLLPRVGGPDGGYVARIISDRPL
jgi:16S rRNA (cytosine967-C5)-methyltransferase